MTLTGNSLAIITQEIHPGEILLEEFLKPMGITNARLASGIDGPTSRIRPLKGLRIDFFLQKAAAIALIGMISPV